jgi:putative chitinase
MWFWEKNRLNDVADTEDIDKATKIINGGTNGLSDRKLLYRRFAKEFGIKKL